MKPMQVENSVVEYWLKPVETYLMGSSWKSQRTRVILKKVLNDETNWHLMYEWYYAWTSTGDVVPGAEWYSRGRGLELQSATFFICKMFLPRCN